MQGSRVNGWLQIFASVSIFAGLLLVAYEINESNRVATTESIAALNSAAIEMSIAEYQSDIHSLYIKSFENPDELSPTEIMKLNSWTASNVMFYGWNSDMYQLGTVRFDPRGDFVDVADIYFGSKFGRAWYAQNRYWINPELAEVMDTALEGRAVIGIPPDVKAIKSRMKLAVQ